MTKRHQRVYTVAPKRKWRWAHNAVHSRFSISVAWESIKLTNSAQPSRDKAAGNLDVNCKETDECLSTAIYIYSVWVCVCVSAPSPHTWFSAYSTRSSVTAWTTVKLDHSWRRRRRKREHAAPLRGDTGGGCFRLLITSSRSKAPIKGFVSADRPFPHVALCLSAMKLHRQEIESSCRFWARVCARRGVCANAMIISTLARQWKKCCRESF